MGTVEAAATETTWVAVAAIAQAVAAFGAMALLLTTYRSLRHADAALEHSDRLATQTERLARAMHDAQALAVKPVIEIRRDLAGTKLVFANVGNGPLLEPAVAGGDGERRHPLQALDETGAYDDVAALKVGQQAFVVLDDGDLAAPLVLRGFTARGDSFAWGVRPGAPGARTVSVERQGERSLREPS